MTGEALNWVRFAVVNHRAASRVETCMCVCTVVLMKDVQILETMKPVLSLHEVEILRSTFILHAMVEQRGLSELLKSPICIME